MTPSETGVSKIKTREEVMKLREEARRDGKRVVLTNGCFDLLHVGHVRYLQQARGLGDMLIIGVNSDESVRRLKGIGRPLNPAMHRAEVLAALTVSDVITVFDEDTAAELAAAVRPDVYVKGGDYLDTPGDERFPVEGHTVLGYGGVVRIIDFEPGASTSALIQRLRHAGKVDAGTDCTPTEGLTVPASPV